MSALPEPSPSATLGVRLLDCAETARWLAERGMASRRGALNARNIKHWADTGKLPMFKSPAGILVITEAALNTWIARAQNEAIKSIEPQAQPAPRRSRGRGR